MAGVVSKNTNELKTGSLGRFRLEVSTLLKTTQASWLQAAR